MTEMIEELKCRITDLDKSVVEVRNLIAMRDQREVDIHEKVDTIYNAIVGDVADGKIGLLARTEILEKSDENKKWLYLGMFTLILNAAWEYIKEFRGR